MGGGKHSARGTGNRGITYGPDNFQSTVEETRRAVHIDIDIVGHASPRWNGASTSQEAILNNLELSKRRTAAVTFWAENYFREELKDFDLTFSYDADVSFETENAPVSHSVSTSSYGSALTFQEAGGNPEANEESLRRVDVYIELSTLSRLKTVRRNKRELKLTPGSKHWGLSIGVINDAKLFQKLRTKLGSNFNAIFFTLRNKSDKLPPGEKDEVQGVILLLSVGGNLSVVDIATMRSYTRLLKLGKNLKKLDNAYSRIRQLEALNGLNKIGNLFSAKLTFGEEIPINTKYAHTLDEFKNVIVRGFGTSTDVLSFSAGADFLTLSKVGEIRENQEDIDLHLKGYMMNFGLVPEIDASVELGARVGIMRFLSANPGRITKEVIDRGRPEFNNQMNDLAREQSVFFDTQSSSLRADQKKLLRNLVKEMSQNFKLFAAS